MHKYWNCEIALAAEQISNHVPSLDQRRDPHPFREISLAPHYRAEGVLESAAVLDSLNNVIHPQQQFCIRLAEITGHLTLAAQSGDGKPLCHCLPEPRLAEPVPARVGEGRPLQKSYVRKFLPTFRQIVQMTPFGNPNRSQELLYRATQPSVGVVQGPSPVEMLSNPLGHFPADHRGLCQSHHARLLNLLMASEVTK